MANNLIENKKVAEVLAYFVKAQVESCAAQEAMCKANDEVFTLFNQGVLTIADVASARRDAVNLYWSGNPELE